MTEKKVLVSGVKPTGRPHVGNYFGAMKQFVELQNQYDSYIFIADLHALTTVQNREEMEENTLGVLLDYMAIGLDPKSVTIYKQSDVPQVSELTWVLNCLTSFSYLMQKGHAYNTAKLELERKMAGIEALVVDNEHGIAFESKNGETYNETVNRIKELNTAVERSLNIGVFDYPILMASDILLPGADIVPVGKDQKQHVEIARDLSEKFNRTFGECFKLPNPLILEDMATVPGTDGRKMSKSYKNTIPLFASDEEIEKAVMSIVTDSGADIPENVYAIHKLIRDKESLDVIYAENKGQYKKLKEALIEDMKNFVRPLRERREELEKNKEAVLKVLKEGGIKAREKAESKMEEVRKLVGLKLY